MNQKRDQGTASILCNERIGYDSSGEECIIRLGMGAVCIEKLRSHEFIRDGHTVACLFLVLIISVFLAS